MILVRMFRCVKTAPFGRPVVPLVYICSEPFSYGNGHESFRWKISVNWPAGEIEFESPGFTLSLTGPVVETDSQHLNDSERNGDSSVA